MVCEACEKVPGTHSFSRIGRTTKGEFVFYTCPARSKEYGNAPNIVKHYKEHLNETGNQPWIWIFDCTDFGLKHMSSLEVGKALAKLIDEEYSHSIQAIYIVNEAWQIKALIDIIWGLIKKTTRQKVHHIKGSTLETIYNLEKVGLDKPSISWLTTTMRSPITS
jgi:hypothetical protein